MNKIMLMGRLTKDPEVRYSKGEKQMAIARYTLAVDRKQKREDGVKADFFQIVAFDRLGEFAERYLRKGIKIAVSGRVQTGYYENSEGVTMPFFEIIAEEQEFAESKNASLNPGTKIAETITEAARNVSSGGNSRSEDGYVAAPEDMDDLPFC